MASPAAVPEGGGLAACSSAFGVMEVWVAGMNDPIRGGQGPDVLGTLAAVP